MLGLTTGLIGFLIFLFVWAATGHGMWVACSRLLRSVSKKRCPECKETLAESDKACRKCGWTTTVNRTTAMRVCNQALSAAYSRGIIDKEAYERGSKAVSELELSLVGKTQNAANSRVQPTEPTSVTARSANTPAPANGPAEMVPKVVVLQIPEIPPVPIVAIPIASPTTPAPLLPSTTGIPKPHALDQEYAPAPPVPTPIRSRMNQTWGKWLSAFIEEKNIQWGELSAGLLILCCSTALVISFWEHIASRSWLKFTIFTGINAATLGLGLNACHRWKLPTTSRGILMIGLLLLPLNFLAFAIFTLGVPWDGWTILGELLSLGLLGCLAWFAAKVVTPHAAVITTATTVGFAVTNLLVRRIIDAESSTPLLLISAGTLVGFYIVVMLMGKRSLCESEPCETNALLRLLGLGTFGFLISFGLLIGCSRHAFQTLHHVSLLLWLVSIPTLIYAIAIGSKATARSQLLLASVVLGAIAIGNAGLAVALAWPMPLLIIVSLTGLGLLIGLVAKELPSAKHGYAWYLIGGCLATLGWHVARGLITLLNEEWGLMLRAIASADTGFVLVAWSGVCFAISLLLSKHENSNSLVALRSAGLSGIAGTLVLTGFGFGRHEYAMSVASIYLLYAIVLIVLAAIRKRLYLDGIAGAFTVAACFQAIAFGWMQDSGWLASIYWSLTTAAILLVIASGIRKSVYVPSVAEEGGTDGIQQSLGLWYRGVAALAVIFAVFWLIVSETGVAVVGSQLIGVLELLALAAVWIVIAYLDNNARDWTVAQVIGTAAGILWIHHYSKNQDWYSASPLGFLQPMSIQMHVAWFALFASVSALVTSVAQRWIGVLKSEAVTAIRLEKVLAQFVTMHRFSIAPGLTWIAVVGFLGLSYYGAAPGSIQELIPRDAIASTQSVEFPVGGVNVIRVIPNIEQLELSALPHGAAGWNAASIKAGFAGLPRMFWLWCWMCMSLAVGVWSKPSLSCSCALISCALSIALPFASQWESEVAVASALRWTASMAYGLGCVVLCVWYLQRSGDASETPDRMTTRFDAYFSTLVANWIVPLLLLGVIVIAGTVQHLTPERWGLSVWIGTGLMAVGGFVVLLIASPIGIKSLGSQCGIAGSILLIAPFLSWFVLQVVLVFIAHPLTGPNGNSIFARMGLAMSYTIPILIFSAGLVANSVVRRSPAIAFAACMVLLLSCLAGYMLTLKSQGLQPAAWVGLLATLTTTSGLFVLIWDGYTQSQWHRRISRAQAEPGLDLDRGFWQSTVRQIAIGFLATSVCLTAVLLLLSGSSLNRLEQFSLAAIVSTGVALSANWFATKKVLWHWWLLAVAFLVAGCVAASAGNSTLSVVLPCVVLLAYSAVMAWRVGKGTAGAGERVALALPLLQSFLLALRLLPIGGKENIAAGLILVVAALSLVTAWRIGRFRFSVGAILAAQIAALVQSSSNWGLGNFFDHVTNLLLMQITMALVMSFLCSVVGFAMHVRFLQSAAVCLLGLMSFFWYVFSLNTTLEPFSHTYYSIAIVASLHSSIAQYWLRSATTTGTDFLVYLSGLCAVGLFFQWVQADPRELQWISTLVFAAYCLASSFVWRGSDRIREAVNRLNVFPTLEARPSSAVVIVANTALALGVVGMGLAAQYLCDSQPLRLASSQAIMSVAFAVGLLARFKEVSTQNVTSSQPDEGSRLLRFTALIFGVCAAVAFGWHFDSIDNVSALNRLSYASLCMALMGMIYGYGLIKWIGLSERWCLAALSLMPYLVFATACSVCSVLIAECALGYDDLYERMSFAAIACIVIALVASIAASLTAAVIPGRDPFGLSEQGRTVYVYASEAFLLLVVMHVRLTMPWLFGGWVQSVWPLLIIGLAFVGLGASEWAKRNRRQVLAEPLERTGMLLPVLPLLTHWIVPSQVDYGVSLLCASVAYASFGYLRKSMLYWGASVVTGNAALWFALHQTHFRFTDHPQLWVIPPALSLLVILQILKERLPRRQLAAGRYMATGSIYVASTAEVFVQGISEAPWLPIVLAGLSVLGIFAGIALRIRAMLWLGAMFLCVAMFTEIWHAAVDLAQTWIWYASGIVMGVLILTMFALFEKRREQLKGLVSTLKNWDD